MHTPIIHIYIYIYIYKCTHVYMYTCIHIPIVYVYIIHVCEQAAAARRPARPGAELPGPTFISSLVSFLFSLLVFLLWSLVFFFWLSCQDLKGNSWPTSWEASALEIHSRRVEPSLASLAYSSLTSSLFSLLVFLLWSLVFFPFMHS